MLEKYTFHIKGLHCTSCVLLTEEKLRELKEIKIVKTSLQSNTIQVTGDFSTKKIEDVTTYLNNTLKPLGYTVSVKKQRSPVHWSEFKIAIPIAAAFIIFFIWLQEVGVVNLITSSEMSLTTAFLIGLIASVSSCMAIVGGLVLSISANFAKKGNNIRPQLLFHVGRLCSFFLLGGFMGMLGSAFQLGFTGTFILNMLVAIVLLILGLNLLDIFPWAKNWQLTIPNFIGKHIYGFKKLNHTLTPLLLGISTFFLPCGFTQSMQLYALTMGQFWPAALIMFTFAIGTLPVLALLSFSSLSLHKKTQSSTFFKIVGLIVIFFGLFNLINSFVAIGIIQPLFNF